MQPFQKRPSVKNQSGEKVNDSVDTPKRGFLKNALAGAGAAALTGGSVQAAPAVITGQPRIEWRLTSSFPKNLDTIYAGATDMADEVFKMTDGRFRIQVFAAGELAPGLGALDVTASGVTEACHTTSYYYVGKNEAFAIPSNIPFGMNMRQQIGWMTYGGGAEAAQKELYNAYNIHATILGNTGAQMGGWMRKRIETPEDVSGLKIRVGGLTGRVFAALGAAPQQIPASDIYPALEKGVIDAAEWVGPYDDLKLGFHKVARYYYYPGWWEGGPCLHLFVNKKAWESLPKHYQAILTAACQTATLKMTAKYDRLNPEALRRLASQGAQLTKYSDKLLDAFYKAATDLYKDLSDKNPLFKKLYALHERYRKDTALWLRYTDAHFDNYMLFKEINGGGV